MLGGGVFRWLLAEEVIYHVTSSMYAKVCGDFATICRASFRMGKTRS